MYLRAWPSRFVVMVGLSLLIPGCVSSRHPFGGGYSHDQQFVSVLPPDDSIPVYPSTRYFYRYVLADEQQPFTPDWALGNLTHLGIKVDEAWYYPGASHTDFGNGAFGATIVRPIFIVGLAVEDRAIMQHNYEPVNNFDPLMRPNGPHSRLTHYVSRRLMLANSAHSGQGNGARRIACPTALPGITSMTEFGHHLPVGNALVSCCWLAHSCQNREGIVLAVRACTLSAMAARQDN